jgi:hypothetical protein
MNARDTSTNERNSNTGSPDTSASDTFAKTSEFAKETADQAKHAASEAAAGIAQQVRELLDRQVGSGAELLGHFARSTKLAAEDLDANTPQLAGLVRGLAGQMEHYSESLGSQSAEQLARAASDLTRRQPALVFGVAALVGYFALRTFKAAPPISSPSIQPSYEGHSRKAQQFHGL